jgi:hypothetical protein
MSAFCSPGFDFIMLQGDDLLNLQVPAAEMPPYAGEKPVPA